MTAVIAEGDAEVQNRTDILNDLEERIEIMTENFATSVDYFIGKLFQLQIILFTNFSQNHSSRSSRKIRQKLTSPTKSIWKHTMLIWASSLPNRMSSRYTKLMKENKFIFI